MSVQSLRRPEPVTAASLAAQARAMSLDQFESMVAHLSDALADADAMLADNVAPATVLAAVRVVADLRRTVVAMDGLARKERGQ
jgi:hypothetical protein